MSSGSSTFIFFDDHCGSNLCYDSQYSIQINFNLIVESFKSPELTDICMSKNVIDSQLSSY